MTNRLALQLSLVVLALISATMLAVSAGLYFLIPVVLMTGLGSFFVTDVLKWFSIEGWIANLALLLILSVGIFEFYPAESSGKLIAVAKLLVYLQAVLFFQEKTPRLSWQIMVLSLLQVVITTIFSIEFEGGLLFLSFFLIAGFALVLQNGFIGEHAIEQRNESTQELRDRFEASGDSPDKRLAWWRNDTSPQPTVTSLAVIQKLKLAPLTIFPGIVLLASLFTSVVFLTAPRNVDPWFSPITYKVSSTGISQQVDLEETGKVDSSSRRIFEVQFRPINSSSDDAIQLNELPYFRGIALSNLSYKDGKTHWNAPYERVYAKTYQPIRNLLAGSGERYAIMDVTMEKTTEPLLYTVMPTGRAEGTLSQLKFCHEVSAYTRCRENEDIDFSPYKYELMVSLSRTNTPARAWPYVANTVNRSTNPMSKDPAQERWLTRIDRKVYPKLVEIADDIAAGVQKFGGRRIDLVRAFENHFLDPTKYSYTLDYNGIDRDLKIDPNEDFVANFKSGHCVAFASAMTLMLRSQGIPARMVVGFHGGVYSDLSKLYSVRGRDAHAWVEVYLSPEDCKRSQLASWEYGNGGAWLRADPTPPRPAEDDGFGTDGAIELARAVWQDYVLGMESKEGSAEDKSLAAALVDFIGDLDIERLSERLATSRKRGWLSLLQPLFFVGVILAAIIWMLRILILKAGYEEEQPETTVGKIRRFFADAIGLISSDLREWVIGHDSETAFYKRLTDILEGHDLVRESTQTHREFASEVASEYASHPSSSLISKVATEVTEAFNRVRFGRQELSPDELRGLENQLSEFDKALKATAKVAS